MSEAAAPDLTVTRTHQATLEQWHEALAKAVRDGAVEALRMILVGMALDWWGHEAEEARRQMVAATGGQR